MCPENEEKGSGDEQRPTPLEQEIESREVSTSPLPEETFPEEIPVVEEIHSVEEVQLETAQAETLKTDATENTASVSLENVKVDETQGDEEKDPNLDQNDIICAETDSPLLPVNNQTPTFDQPPATPLSDEEKPSASAEPQKGLKTEVVPDIKELTIKNLDTGEQYVIGENDPDFEFDTFPLTGDVGDDGNPTGLPAQSLSSDLWQVKLPIQTLPVGTILYWFGCLETTPLLLAQLATLQSLQTSRASPNSPVSNSVESSAKALSDESFLQSLRQMGSSML
jgi:hypothetical protein